MSPNLIPSGSHQVFGFNAPSVSMMDSMGPPPQTVGMNHHSSSGEASPQELMEPQEPDHVRSVLEQEKSAHSVSPAINTKSFHTNRKISPPLNRPEHLRFT